LRLSVRSSLQRQTRRETNRRNTGAWQVAPNYCGDSPTTVKSSHGNNTKWKYLVRKPKSNYLQLFIKDRWIAARTLFGQSMGEDARTPKQLAADYRLPLEAVLEAIAYCESNPPEIHEDWQREQSTIDAASTNDSIPRATPSLATTSPE
jgi:hypothetical protein